MPFEEILRRVKGQARAKKLETYAQNGRSGISLGVRQANGRRSGKEYETWGDSANAQTSGGEEPQELNSAQTRQGKDGKAKGKGKDGKGKRQGGWKERRWKEGKRTSEGRMLYLRRKALGIRVRPECSQERRWPAQGRRARAASGGGDETLLHDELRSRNRREGCWVPDGPSIPNQAL